MSEQFEAEYKLTKNLEILTDRLQSTYRELEEEKKKTDRLLYSVLPPTVANDLRHGRPVPAKKYEAVTILFSGIVGFTEFCSKNSDSFGAMKIVKLLNSIYTTFDVLTDPKKNPNVYKVRRFPALLCSQFSRSFKFSVFPLFYVLSFPALSSFQFFRSFKFSVFPLFYVLIFPLFYVFSFPAISKIKIFLREGEKF